MWPVQEMCQLEASLRILLAGVKKSGLREVLEEKHRQRALGWVRVVLGPLEMKMPGNENA